MRADIVCIVAGTMSALKNLVNDGWHQRAATRHGAILEHGLTQSKHAFDGTQVVSFLAVHALAPTVCQRLVGDVFFLLYVCILPSARVIHGLEIEHTGCTGVTAEIDAIGRKINGQLREPNRKVPVIRPNVEIHEDARAEPRGQAKLKVVDRVSEAEMALASYCGRA